MTDMAYDVVIDVKDLQCPRPLLKTKQILREMKSGNVLKVLSTDKTTRMTFASYLKNSGDEHLKIVENKDEIHHYIRKK